ncbi:MAG TPA: MaoC/PaaZ C-terminal domain-containing protein [Pseudomonadales bacterium]|nr:MaoC/PaaZ C-terminal domain-containing protein [Pseudomonadales bacterium]
MMKTVFADIGRTSLHADAIQVGDAITPMDIPLTHTMIAATAIASMDFMPVHHDKDYALSQFAPDAFLNILSSNGFVSKFLTDWAGPDAWVKKISIKLGVPAVPHQVLKFTGEVLSKNTVGNECHIEVSVQAANDSGNHATGTAVITLPL